MSTGNNYNSIMVAIMICVGIIVASVVLVPILLGYTQPNNNYNNNPQYSLPTPTPTPTPKPAMFNIYNKDAVSSSTGLINVNYKATISADVTNYGETAGFVYLKGYVKQNDTTKEQTQTLYLSAGETKHIHFSFENMQSGSYQYNIIQT